MSSQFVGFVVVTLVLVRREGKCKSLLSATTHATRKTVTMKFTGFRQVAIPIAEFVRHSTATISGVPVIE